MGILKKRISDLRLITRTVKLVWNCCRSLTAASFLIMFLQGALPIVPVYIIKLIVDAVATQQPFGRILPYVIAIGGAIILNALLKSVGGYISNKQSLILVDYMQELIQDKSLELDLSFYDNPDFFDKMHRAQQEAPTLPAQIINNLMGIIRSGISTAGIAGLLIVTLPWYIVIILVITALPMVAVRIVNSKRSYAWYMKNTTAARRVDYLNWLLTGQGHARELRLLGLGKLLKERSQKGRDDLRSGRLELSAKRTRGEFITTGIQAAVTAGLIGYFAYNSIYSDGSLGDLVLFFQAIQKGQQVLGDLLQGGAVLYESTLYLQNVYDFMDLEPAIKKNESEVSAETSSQGGNRSGIIIKNVSFSYPGIDRKVLQNINIEAGSQEFIAIVGDNGAGKSTLTKLLSRFYDPSEGIVMLNGTDMRTLNEDSIRSYMAVLQQDFTDYHYSAAENIWLGDITKDKNTENIAEAARKAGIDKTLESLPQGYDTMLGRYIEDGSQLSGGQWKKLALARALFREAPIVILDEPTANLDPIAETEFIDSLPGLAEGRCLIMISHKIASVRQADRIYVMRDGRVIETGSHDELIRQNGYYAGLYHTQLRQMGKSENDKDIINAGIETLRESTKDDEW